MPVSRVAASGVMLRTCSGTAVGEADDDVTLEPDVAPGPDGGDDGSVVAGPVGAVRVGRVNSEFIANPTHTQREQSDLDLIYVGTENDIIMIEGAANELPEDDFVRALEFAHSYAKEMIRVQKELATAVGKPKREMPLVTVNPEILAIADRVAGGRIEAALYTEGKVARSNAVNGLRDEVKTAVLEKFPEADNFTINQAFDYIQKKSFRGNILDKQRRVDGRGYEDLRPISCEVGVLPRAHGSAIFQRGETQAMALATLAPIEEAQMIDAYGGGEPYFDAITDLQIDLLAHAMGCGITRVATLFLSDLSRTHLDPQLPDDVHIDVAHRYSSGGRAGGGDPASWLQLARQNRYACSKLARLLQQLDRERPELSPLLIEPQRRHGGTTAPVFDKFSQRQLAEIAAWIDITLPRPVESVPTTISVPPPGQTLSQAVDATPRGPVVPAAAQEPVDGEPVGDKASDIAPAATVEAGASADRPVTNPAADGKHAPAKAGSKSSAKISPSAAEKAFIPRDPFDPEIFNRRHRTKPASTAVAGQP